MYKVEQKMFLLVGRVLICWPQLIMFYLRPFCQMWSMIVISEMLHCEPM